MCVDYPEVVRMSVGACEEKEKRSDLVDYDCLPHLQGAGQSVEKARILDRIAVILGRGAVLSIVPICVVVCCSAVIAKGGTRTSALVLQVICVSFAVLAATVFTCCMFLSMVSSIRHALRCRETQGTRREADSYYRRTSREYEKDVMSEVDRLTDIIIGDGVSREYTAAGYIRDVGKEANRTAGVIIDEMQFGNAELDEARDRERAITRYKKDVMEDAAKIVDAVIRSMKLERECSSAIVAERKSATYVEDVKSSADKAVDNAIDNTKIIYRHYDDCTENVHIKGAAETGTIVRDLLKHIKVEGVHKYAQSDIGQQK